MGLLVDEAKYFGDPTHLGTMRGALGCRLLRDFIFENAHHAGQIVREIHIILGNVRFNPRCDGSLIVVQFADFLAGKDDTDERDVMRAIRWARRSWRRWDSEGLGASVGRRCSTSTSCRPVVSRRERMTSPSLALPIG